MADGINPTSILQQIYDMNQRQIGALQQPAPQQGGFLSGADPVMLSLAAGLLSPTKTGAFGESIGAGLQAAQGPLTEIRRQEAARSDKLSSLMNAQAKLAMDMYEIQTGGRRRGEDPSMTAKRIIDIAREYKAEYESNPDSPEGKAAKRKFDYFRNQAEGILGYPVDFEGEDMQEAPAPQEEQGWGEWFKEKIYGKEPTKTAPAKEAPKPKPKAKTVEEAPAEEPQATGKSEPKPYTGEKPPAKYPNAKKGRYGYWYIPVDPSDPSKGYQYVAE